MADLRRGHDEHHQHLEHHENLENPSVTHEHSDVNITAILAFGGGLIVIAIVIHLLMYVLLGYFQGREPAKKQAEYPLAAAQGARVPPEPRLQINPREDLANLRAREDQQLTSYGWVDKNAGIVRIPIDAAIQLTLQRGLPARTESNR